MRQVLNSAAFSLDSGARIEGIAEYIFMTMPFLLSYHGGK
jgi:hypothetical protein